jgi:hypothetical protein
VLSPAALGRLGESRHRLLLSTWWSSHTARAVRLWRQLREPAAPTVYALAHNRK